MRLNRILRAFLWAVCLLLVTLFLYSGWNVFSILRGYKVAAQRYGALSDSVVSSPSAPVPTPQPEPTQTAAQEEEPPRERSPVSVDFSELSRLSGDVVGWLYLPDTVINYPLVQGSDNAYYLDRFLDGRVSSGGTLFVDFVCPADFSGRNTLIYGHNMKDGSMFALVDDYADKSFYEAHPVLYLNTPTQNYRIDIFSAFTTDPESFVYTTEFADESDYYNFLSALLSSSEIRCHSSVSLQDRVVTLSTCTYSGEDLRFVVCGKLIEID